MKEHAQGDIVLEEDDGIYEKGDILRSFHHQARQPMSRKALLAGFFIGLVEEMCGAISFQRCHPSYCLTAGHSSGTRSLSWASSGDGVLFPAGSPCTDGGFLQTTSNEEGKRNDLTP